MNISQRVKRETVEGVDFNALRRMLAALSDPTRQQIVAVLSRERLNVTDLTKRFSLSQPAISHHLRILSNAGLLIQGRHVGSAFTVSIRSAVGDSSINSATSCRSAVQTPSAAE